jgi:hypothetical protein
MCFAKPHRTSSADRRGWSSENKKLLTGKVNVSWSQLNSFGSCRGAFGRHNRSGELWSPLVELAAFFEERGAVTGLLQAISEAAEWDEQVRACYALETASDSLNETLRHQHGKRQKM